MMLLGLLVWFTLREPPRGHSDGKLDTDAVPSMLEVLRYLGRKPAFIHLTLGAALIGFVAYGNNFFLMPFLVRNFALDHAEAGMRAQGAQAGIGLRCEMRRHHAAGRGQAQQQAYPGAALRQVFQVQRLDQAHGDQARRPADAGAAGIDHLVQQALDRLPQLRAVAHAATLPPVQGAASDVLRSNSSPAHAAFIAATSSPAIRAWVPLSIIRLISGVSGG